MYDLEKYPHFVSKVANLVREKANIALLAILTGFIVWAVHSTASSQPVVLKPGMPNTITLPNGEVVYDLNGEWDAVYDRTYLWAGGVDQKESSKDIVRITQEGNQFVGIKLIGDVWVGKNQEAIQGELGKNRFRKLYAFMRSLRWVPGKGEISEDGNRIVIRARPSPNLTMTIVLTRKYR